MRYSLLLSQYFSILFCLKFLRRENVVGCTNITMVTNTEALSVCSSSCCLMAAVESDQVYLILLLGKNSQPLRPVCHLSLKSRRKKWKIEADSQSPSPQHFWCSFHWSQGFSICCLWRLAFWPIEEDLVILEAIFSPAWKLRTCGIMNTFCPQKSRTGGSPYFQCQGD